MKKNRGEESIGIIIQVYMELSQGNSLCSYLKQAKVSIFSFSFYKISEQEGRTGPAEGGGRSSTSERGKVVGKVCRRVNMV
jgi:hypothetical protein